MSDKGKPQDDTALEDRVADLELRVTALEADFTDLTERVSALEEGESTPPPDVEEPPPSDDATLQELVDAGGDVTLPKAEYKEFCTITKPTQVSGMPTTIDVTGMTIGNGKAIFEANADLELSDLILCGASVPDNNGCGVRGGVGASILLERVESTGNEMGLLLAGGNGARIDLRDCQIHHNGLPSGGLGHEIYINALNRSQYGDCVFTISDSTVVGGDRTCIAIKSRATNTTIRACELRGSTSTNSSVAGRVVDIPDGGEVLIENTLIELQATSPTSSILGVCTESIVQGAGSVRLRNVIISDKRNRGGELWARAGAGCTLILENCTYTANAAPTLTGWASVTGQFTKA